MNRTTIIELCFIIAGFFAINFFVEKVLDPNYTAGWQSRAEWQAAGGEGGMPRDKVTYEADIMRKRKVDRFAFFAVYGFLIAGYYCAKAARKEIKRRGVIIPADGTQPLELNIMISNRRIASMRFMAILLCLIFVIAMPSLILGHPMQDIDEAGRIVNTNPYFGKDQKMTIFLFVMYMPIALCIAPYYVFRKITNILSLRDCLMLFATVLVIMIVCILLRLPRYSGPLVASAVSGLGIFMSFGKKINLVAKTVGF